MPSICPGDIIEDDTLVAEIAVLPASFAAEHTLVGAIREELLPVTEDILWWPAALSRSMRLRRSPYPSCCHRKTTKAGPSRLRGMPPSRACYALVACHRRHADRIGGIGKRRCLSLHANSGRILGALPRPGVARPPVKCARSNCLWPWSRLASLQPKPLSVPRGVR